MPASAILIDRLGVGIERLHALSCDLDQPMMAAAAQNGICVRNKSIRNGYGMYSWPVMIV